MISDGVVIPVGTVSVAAAAAALSWAAAGALEVPAAPASTSDACTALISLQTINQSNLGKTSRAQPTHMIEQEIKEHKTIN